VHYDPEWIEQKEIGDLLFTLNKNSLGKEDYERRAQFFLDKITEVRKKPESFPRQR